MDDSHYMPPDSTKEVTPSTNPDYAGLQVARDRPTVQSAWNAYVKPTASKRAGTYCGLPRSTLFLGLTLIIVIIAAAIGGGVGGSLAVRNARK